MKLFAYAVALAGLAAAAPMNAQILSSRIPTTSRSTNDGQWYSVGRDNSGNTVYERQTYDANGNTVIQRGRRNSNGTFTILSSRTVANNGNNRNNDCNYSQTTNSVGDIIFGRSSANVSNCDDRNSRVSGGWYQVGRDGSGSRVYERRTTDNNGNVIIQRARRNSNGSFTILSSRNVGRGNGTWNNGRGNNNGNNSNNDTWDRGNRNGMSDKEWQKEQKRREKEWKKSHKGNNGNGND